MKYRPFSVALVVVLLAVPTFADNSTPRLPRKHVIIEADYLPDKGVQAEPFAATTDAEWPEQARAFESPTPAENSIHPESVSPFDATSGERESREAGMSPEALRVLEMPKNEILLGHDPAVAVSPHYIVAIEAHSLVFYDKRTGKRLAQTTAIPTALGSAALFRPFMAKTLDGHYDAATGKLIGTPNPLNLNNFAELPPGACDLTDRNKQYGCAPEVFDLRVLYDSQRGRFIFAGTSRRPRSRDNPNVTMRIGGKDVVVAREMSLIAVSRDEDPRNGFHEYLYTEGGDWPRIAVNDRVLTMTSWDGRMVFQFSADDLAKGVKSPAMARWNMHDGKWPFNGYVYTVAQRAPWDGYSWLIKCRTNEQFMTLYAIKGIGGSITEVRIPIKNAASHPLTSVHDWWTDPVLRGGKLYVASTDAMHRGMVVRNGVDPRTNRPPVFRCRFYDEQWISLLHDPDPQKRADGERTRNAGPCRIRLLGFTLDKRPDGISGINDVDLDIGQAASDDPPGAVMAYILPAIDVTKRGAVVIVYMRTQFNKLPDRANEISPEVRYSVYYPGEKAVRHSRLLHRGSGVDNHPDPNQKPALRAGNYFGLDLAQVSVDEDDVAWMAAGYSIGAKDFQEVVGAVRP